MWDSVAAAVQSLGKASVVVDGHDRRRVSQLCERLKEFLLDDARRLIEASDGRPVLYEYVGDATPLSLRFRNGATLDAVNTVHRSGRQTIELFCQAAFVRTVDGLGRPLMRAILRDPRPLAGKTALHQFVACREFFPKLQTIRSTGFSIHHYCWDRAIYSALRRFVLQDHALHWRSQRVSLDPTARLQEAKTFVLFSGCALHDAQNSMSWAVSRHLVGGTTMVDDFFIVGESLRNSWVSLQSRLITFLERKIAFVEQPVDAEVLRRFWQALDVPSHLGEMLAERGVFWKDDMLEISSAYQCDEGLVPFLYTACMMIFRFKKCTSTRWLTMGSSARAIVSACAVGLTGLYKLLEADPEVSMFNLGGFKRLSESMMRYLVVACMSCRPAESLQRALLEDDRAARRRDELFSEFWDEFQWLAELPGAVWICLAGLVGRSSSALELRSDCLEAAFLSGGYVDRRLFSKLRARPWDLLSGDIRSNLATLEQEAERPSDPTAAKLWTLMRLGANRQEMYDALSMMAESRFSTAVAEQLHGTAAVLHRLHRDLGQELLTARTMVSFARPLLAEDPAERLERKGSQKLESLDQEQPERCGGRQLFIGECVTNASRVVYAQGGKMTLPSSSKLMQLASKEWSAMPADVRRQWDMLAHDSAARKRKRIEDDKSQVRSDLNLHLRRAAEEASTEGVVTRVSSCRWHIEQQGELQRMWKASTTGVDELRKAALAPPRPSATLQHELDQVPVSREDELNGNIPDWCRRVSTHRELFHSCILLFSTPTAKNYFAVCFAEQKPVDVILAPLERIHGSDDGPDTPSQELGRSGAMFDSTFRFRQGEYISGRAMHEALDTHVWVMLEVVYWSGSILKTNSQPILLMDYLKGVPEKVAKPAKESTATKSRPQGVLAQCPWFARFLAGGSEEPGERRVTDGASASSARSVPAAELDEETVCEVMSALAAKRAEHAEADEVVVAHFEVVVTGGAWCLANLGVPYDGVRGKSKTAEIAEWCRAAGMSMSLSCSFKLFGERMSNLLAAEWCRKMQFFFDVWSREAHLAAWPAGVEATYTEDPSFTTAVSADPRPATQRKAQSIRTMRPAGWPAAGRAR